MTLDVSISPGEDGWLVAEVPALPGCISQGRTNEEAILNIREAIEGWLLVEQSKHDIDPEAERVKLLPDFGHLPIVSGRLARRALERGGWPYATQHGSHMILTKPGNRANLAVPDHSELDRGTLRSTIRSAGLSVDEFLDLLHG